MVWSTQKVFIIWCSFLGFSLVLASCPPSECYVYYQCDVVTCHQDECLHFIKPGNDPGCCSSNTECQNNLPTNQEIRDCLSPNCYTPYYTCANTWTCSTDFPPIEGVCTETEDCLQYTSYCAPETFCYNNRCQVIRPNPDTLEAGCCIPGRNPSNCAEIPCMESYCHPDLYMCVYEPLAGCSSPNNSPSPTPQLSPAPSGSATPTKSLAPSESSSKSPSKTISLSSSLTNSTSISPTPTPTETGTETGTGTATPTSSISFSSTASESGTPTESEILQSKSESASQSISLVKSINLSATEAVQTTVVAVTHISSSGESAGSSSWLWIVLVILALGFVVAGVIAVAAGLVLRQRFMNNRFRPIDLIEEDEFPM